MKSLAILAVFVSVAALAQDNPPQGTAAPTAPAAQIEAAPAIATAADPSAKPEGGHKICRLVHGYSCGLSDKSLEPGSHCMCHDHPGTVDVQ